MELNPTTKEKEFGGVFGVLSIVFGLPALLIVINQLVNENYHLVGIDLKLDDLLNFHNKTISELCFNGKVWCVYALWFFGLLFFDLTLPGYYTKGLKLRDGTRLSYKINGIAITLLLIIVLVVRFYLTFGELPELQFLYNNLLEFTITAIIFSVLLSNFVYIYSFVPLIFSKNGLGTNEKILAVGGNTKNLIYDWFIGRELNPRIGFWDIKLFCELRPGMLLWLLINLSCMHQQWLELGYVTDSMLLLNILQAVYIFDGVLNEEGCLSMMDITTDGFGFMLAFGDLALVPFSYTIQARYLKLEPLELGTRNVVLILITSLIGFYIFKASNIQKSKFRSGLLKKEMKSIKTDRGTKLLCDGWWKLSQHINYFGDWLHALSWCLTTGFMTPLTYYYAFYFGALLLHRQKRDEQKCKEKYGDSWVEYEKRVPYKIVPYLY